MNRLSPDTGVIFIFLILLIFSSDFINSQTNIQEEINNQFSKAVSLFDKGNYDDALQIFNKLIIDYKFNSKTTASEFFKIKIYFEQKQLNQFKYSAEQFIKAYPGSNYIDEIRILLTKYYLVVANYYNALRELLFIIENTNSYEYENKAKKYGEGIAAKYLNETQLDRLGSLFISTKVKSYLLLQIGKCLLRKGNLSSAKNKFEELMAGYPDSDEFMEAKRLVDISYSNKSTTKIIGVMLPLEENAAGEFTSQPALEILEGIKFAVDEYNKLRSDKIGLLVRDTNKDANQIKKIREEFSSLNSVIAIIGPVFSNEVRIALQEFEEYDIPIISPTATDDDLTTISQNFFQANPSFSIRGKVMAQYVYYVENRRTVSVLNSIEGYSPVLAASFINEFEKLGGKVIKKVSFKNDYTDFSEPINKIYIDSLLIEGVYIPLSDNSVAPFIFSALIKYGVKIPIYGNQDWFTAKGFETAPAVSNNLIFTSDYFVDFNSEVYKNFSDQFNRITGKDVNRNVLYGYDTAKYILTVIRNSEPNRKSIVDKIKSGMVSNGLRNNISFDERRVNKYLNLVRYKDGVFELVDKFRLGQ